MRHISTVTCAVQNNIKGNRFQIITFKVLDIITTNSNEQSLEYAFK